MKEHKQDLLQLAQLPRRPLNRAKIDLGRTEYPLLRNVALLHGWKIFDRHLDKREEVTLFWRDNYVDEDEFNKLLPYQRINHFPGSQELGNKRLLALNVRRLASVDPAEYSFVPRTWLLPEQNSKLQQYLASHPGCTMICKPAGDSQGRGIYLIKQIGQLTPETEVVQEYLDKPFLIDGLKCDIRLYVLLQSVDPLRAYLFQEGLVRLATKPYVSPSRENLDQLHLHLTNYAINRWSPDFKFNTSLREDHVGHKRSYSALLKLLGDDASARLQEQVAQLIAKTLICASKNMREEYRKRFKQTPDMCFELLGFDLLLDQHCRPHLLEVNHAPSFCTDTPLDLQIKRLLIHDTFMLVNPSLGQFRAYLQSKNTKQFVQFPFVQPDTLGGFKKIFPKRVGDKLDRLMKLCIGKSVRVKPFKGKREDSSRQSVPEQNKETCEPRHEEQPRRRRGQSHHHVEGRRLLMHATQQGLLQLQSRLARLGVQFLEGELKRDFDWTKYILIGQKIAKGHTTQAR